MTGPLPRLPDQDAEPDYILFASAAEKEAVIAKGRAQRYQAAVAVLEAKKVNHPLSQISRRQQRYPHQQIRDYLQEAQALTWGILTNGNEWRLYCRDAKPSEFFALNFAVAIQSLENFKYFLALFGPAAFVRDPQGKCRLDLIRDRAIAAQSELEEDLRRRIFQLVETLANGFAERPENAITDVDFPRLYDNCLIFLYRLLFILYAEGRNLLPVEPRTRKYYKDLSLARLLTPLKNFSEYDSHTRTRLYEDIRELCHLINGSDEAKNREYGVPRYNGGLFDPDRYPDLERWRICDAVLADVLRGLLFNPPPDPQQPALPIQTVDYADLRVQQLGSIYEGLLEHHLARENGRLVLKTDKAERKATGTYYTPDYIVKYIVENTLGPLLAEIEQSPEVQAAKQAGRQDNSFAEAVLRLNICDPAMGSGHFLVETTTFLADHIATHPTTRPQSPDAKDEAEIAYWRRRVVEACIYGVDINPLAVELAKLSLWLVTIATDQPLNFLDHHLRCGNSLLGARLDDLRSIPEKKRRKPPPGAPQQTEFSFGPDFVRAVADVIREIHAIETRPSSDVGAVKDKETHWRDKVLPVLAPYKAAADLWTSTFFGHPLDNETYVATAQRILAGNEPPESSRAIAAARRFFHWELEFPEVFFNPDATRRANPGFDAVIGNPPYGRLLDKEEIMFAKILFEAATGVGDVFGMFIEQGATLSANNGSDGWIVPSGWLTAREHCTLRSVVLSHLSPRRIVHLPHDVFGAAYIDCIVFIAQKRTPSLDAVCLVKRFGFREKVKQIPCSPKAYLQVNVGAWLQAPNKLMVTESGPGQWLGLWQRNPKFVPLGEILRVSRGITPFTEPNAGERRQTAYGYFGSVGRYYLEPDRLALVVYEPSLMEYRPPAFFTGKRLIIRRIISRQHRIHAALATEDFVVNKSSLLALKKQQQPYALEFALGVLNSRLISKALTSMSEIAKRDDFPQLDIATVCELPVPRISFTTPGVERKRLVKRGRELYESALERGDMTPVLAFAEQELKADRTDVLHDLLAFLAERMMTLNKEKHVTARKFLADLKDFHGIDAHALKPKTKLDEFWKLETAAVFEHFRANKLRLKDSDEEKIRARFQKAKDKIVPLEAQLAFTDRLIDQIVYRLYGLTDDEIKLVEESAPR